MRQDVYDHIKVSRLPTWPGRISPAAQLEVLAASTPGGTLILILLLLHPSRAGAIPAGGDNDLPSAAALGAGRRGDHLSERGVLGAGDLTRAAAVAAGGGAGAGLGPAAVAGGAASVLGTSMVGSRPDAACSK